MEIKISKKGFLIEDSFYGNKIFSLIPFKKEKFKNNGFYNVNNLEEHIKYLSNNFYCLYKSMKSSIKIDFKDKTITFRKKVDNNIFCLKYELNNKKYKTTIRVENDGIIHLCIMMDD